MIALKIRGEQVDDIAAAANVMRQKAQTIKAPEIAMDIVGTGGDGFGTLIFQLHAPLLWRVAEFRLPNTE